MAKKGPISLYFGHTHPGSLQGKSSPRGKATKSRVSSLVTSGLVDVLLSFVYMFIEKEIVYDWMYDSVTGLC